MWKNKKVTRSRLKTKRKLEKKIAAENYDKKLEAKRKALETPVQEVPAIVPPVAQIMSPTVIDNKDEKVF